MKKLKALLAWTQFQYACDHKDCVIFTFTPEVMEEWMQQIDLQDRIKRLGFEWTYQPGADGSRDLEAQGLGRFWSG